MPDPLLPSVPFERASAVLRLRWRIRSEILDFLAREVAERRSRGVGLLLASLREKHGRAMDTSALYSLRRHAFEVVLGSRSPGGRKASKASRHPSPLGSLTKAEAARLRVISHEIAKTGEVGEGGGFLDSSPTLDRYGRLARQAWTPGTPLDLFPDPPQADPERGATESQEVSTSSGEPVTYVRVVEAVRPPLSGLVEVRLSRDAPASLLHDALGAFRGLSIANTGVDSDGNPVVVFS